MVLSDTVLYYWLSLAANRQKVNLLLSIYSPLEIWESIANDVQIAKLIGEKNYQALLRFKNEDYLAGSLSRLDDQGIGILARSDKRFPVCLAQAEVDPPLLLYYKGDISLMQTDCIAIVGTRACSRYGKDMAEKFSRELCGEGLTIVSGLATGIDMYAHGEALRCGGKTIAVLGSGLNRMAPMSNYGLFERISREGLVLSEYPPNQEATRYTFPERNRIVSGLSLGVLVIEAPERSGALITVNDAYDQSREVFVVPANADSIKARGSNALLKEREAHIVLCGQDVCNELNRPSRRGSEKTQAIQLDIYQQKIYNILQNGDESFDALVLQLGSSPQELSVALSALEIYGLIRKKQSNIYGIK